MVQKQGARILLVELREAECGRSPNCDLSKRIPSFDLRQADAGPLADDETDNDWFNPEYIISQDFTGIGVAGTPTRLVWSFQRRIGSSRNQSDQRPGPALGIGMAFACLTVNLGQTRNFRIRSLSLLFLDD
jgi:hypothetical protein